MSKQVMEMAREALKGMVASYGYSFFSGSTALDKANTCIAALEEAIKQAGEPVAKLIDAGSVGGTFDWIGGCKSLPPGTKLFTSAPSIPEGWQLVPKEPTPEMQYEGKGAYANDEDWNGIYAAMLSAAPSIPEDVAKDAARYRWLRDNPAWQKDHELCMTIQLQRNELWDASIDAAMLSAAPSYKGENSD